MQRWSSASATSAFEQWSSELISDALRAELAEAAAEVGLDLPRYAGEILESFAASRRLPRCASWYARVYGDLSSDGEAATMAAEVIENTENFVHSSEHPPSLTQAVELPQPNTPVDDSVVSVTR